MSTEKANGSGMWLAVDGDLCPLLHDTAIRNHLQTVSLRGAKVTSCPECGAHWQFQKGKPPKRAPQRSAGGSS